MFEELFGQQGLSMERLHALLQLEEQGSLIKAAGDNKGKQSRYSHHLRELSAFFGVELTIRAGKTLQLTPAGKELTQIAREYFQSLTRYRQNVREQPRDFLLGAEDGLLQWLVIPKVGTLRRADRPFRFVLQSLQTADTLDRLFTHRLDFGLVRANLVPRGLGRAPVCTLDHAIVVPERLVLQRGLLTLKRALLDCPHAVVGNDDQLVQQITELAHSMGGQFRPELICDSVGHCVTAVRSGYYAAILPLQSWPSDSPVPCHVVEGPPLENLRQPIALAWHGRLLDVGGPIATRVKDMLVAILRQKETLK